MESNIVQLEIVLEFESIFPNETPCTPNEYLKGENRDVILRVASFFLGFHIQNSEYEDNQTLLKNIFFKEKENEAFARNILQKINDIEKKEQRKVTIINPLTSLMLFELFYDKKAEQERTQQPAEFERNLFKAYLVLNSQYLSKQKIAIESTRQLDEEKKLQLGCSVWNTQSQIKYIITRWRN